MQWNPKLHIWDWDEWLIDIYDDPWMAKAAVESWGEGRSWDNNRELQITRCYKKRTTPEEPGEEIPDGNPAVCEKMWLRYAEFRLKERGDDDGTMDC